MNLTFGDIWFIIIIVLVVAVIALYVCASFDWEPIIIIVSIIVGIIIIVVALIGLNWYNTSTASGQRKVKDFQTEIQNGLNREITITSEDGREIFHYIGKVDIEDNDRYILFESEKGERYIIYYGVQDTVIIKEILD